MGLLFCGPLGVKWVELHQSDCLLQFSRSFNFRIEAVAFTVAVGDKVIKLQLLLQLRFNKKMHMRLYAVVIAVFSHKGIQFQLQLKVQLQLQLETKLLSYYIN